MHTICRFPICGFNRQLFAAIVGLAACWACNPQAASAQQPDPVLEFLNTKAVDFLGGIGSESGVDKSFEVLLTSSPLQNDQEKMQMMVARTKELRAKYGEFRKVTPLPARRVGENLVLLKYLYECERYPVVWYFTYYRVFKANETPRDTENWVLVALRFDTDLESLAQD